MKLPIIVQDKANHFIYGFTIFILSNLVFNDLISLAIICTIGFGKEVYDEWDYGGFDIVDFIYTIIPAIVLNLKQLYTN
jgi:hypothetical protein